MAIDTSIINRLQPATIQQQDPFGQYAKQLQLKALLSEQQARERGLADENAQREAFQQSGGDTAKYLQALASGGNYKAYQAAMAQDLAQKKAQAEYEGIGAKTEGTRATTQKTLTDTQVAKIAQHRDLLSNVATPQDAMVWIQEAGKNNLYSPEILQGAMNALQGASQSPEAFNQWKQQAALGATKYIEQNKPTYQTRNLGGVTQTLALPGLGGAPTVANTAQNTVSPDAKLSAETQRRGQNLVDARARLTAEQTLTKPFEITGADGKPVLVQQDKQGNIKPVQGFGPKQGASKPLTDTQAKALQFGSRMQDAEDIFASLASNGVNTSIPGSQAGYGIGATISALQPEQWQQLDQAKRNFINAALRRESGAVISPSEFDNAEKQYFPQPGDGPKVIAQKKANRELATRGILAEVPDMENRVKAVRQTPESQTFNSLPDPASLNGRRIQGPDGKILRSNGKSWVPE